MGVKTQWLMEQAAIKAGAMGPPDRRSQGANSGHPAENATPQGIAAAENKGGVGTATGTTHGANGGQQNLVNNRTSLVGANANNGGSGVDGLGATKVAGAGPMAGGTGAAGVGGGVPFLSSGDSLEQIYQSTRTWCRTLRRSPNAMEVLLSYARKCPRPQSGILFNQYLSDLTGIMYRRLSTTVEEEVKRVHLHNGLCDTITTCRDGPNLCVQ